MLTGSGQREAELLSSDNKTWEEGAESSNLQLQPQNETWVRNVTVCCAGRGTEVGDTRTPCPALAPAQSGMGLCFPMDRECFSARFCPSAVFWLTGLEQGQKNPFFPRLMMLGGSSERGHLPGGFIPLLPCPGTVRAEHQQGQSGMSPNSPIPARSHVSHPKFWAQQELRLVVFAVASGGTGDSGLGWSRDGTEGCQAVPTAGQRCRGCPRALRGRIGAIFVRLALGRSDSREGREVPSISSALQIGWKKGFTED